ncbi:AAA domain-containing protein [Actinoplanes sp. NPDC049802]|uniref:AAA domain-containing protein n=1 Tax=Actinoplanes sp. NPDC049802 TaxID=3154742 RepID=UPI0033D4C6AF
MASRQDDDRSEPRPARAGVHAALRAWRDSLIDLGDNNRLINFVDGNGDAVEFTSPDADEVVATLTRGGLCTLAGSDDGTGRDVVALRAELPGRLLGPSLRRMMRRAQQENLDRGVAVLHLALGLLHWRLAADDEDADVEAPGSASPLLLLPAELVAGEQGGNPGLRLADADPVLNPALVLRLRRAGITVPAPDPGAELRVSRFWDEVTDTVARRHGWHVERSVILTCLTFHKEAIYRDLEDNEQRILAHPAIRALATTGPQRQTDRFRFTPIRPEDADRIAPPEDVPLVLDADSSQRACVAAALAGHSFVMDGPPGTGKSQTVANMIGALLHAGKRVLFVSEKVAALDVVRNRLAESGLDRYLLELHGQKAGRREVATLLAAAVDEAPEPPGPGPAMDRDALRERRERLTAYAYAMNETRRPLGAGLHEIIGRCAGLAKVPAAPAPAIAPDTLTPDVMHRIRKATDQLARTWRAMSGGDALLWRDVTTREPLDPALSRAEKALAALARTARAADRAAGAFGLRRPSDAPTLARLAEHAGARPEQVADDWLTAADLDPVREAADRRGEVLAAATQAAEAVKQRAGVPWNVLPDPADLPPVPALDGLAAPVDLGALTAADADELALSFTRAAEQLEKHRRAVDRITARLGLPPVATCRDIAGVAAVVELGTRKHKPERFWFRAGALAAVQTGASTLRRALETLVAAEIQARPYFSEAILAQPIEELAERFTHVHRGFRKLFGAYRQDKRQVAGFVLPNAHLGVAISRIGTAVAWKRALQELAAAEHSYATALGRYWQGRGTDFAALDEAIAVASSALAVAPPSALEAVVGYLCAPAPDPVPIQVVTEARDALLRWQATLRPAPYPAARPDLVTGPIDDAITWLQRHSEALQAAAETVRAHDFVTGRHLDYAETVRLGELRATAQQAAAALGARTGELPEAEPAALAAAIAWAATAREIAGGPLTPAQVTALRELRPVPALAERAREWQEASRAVLDGFGPARQEDLRARFADYRLAAALLRDIRDDSSGQEEWFACLEARDVLAFHGLDAAVEFCADQNLSSAMVPAVLERALLHGWVDAVARADDRLRPWRGSDRDRLVAEFRQADEKLAAVAARDIIAAVEARRPPADSTAAQLLRREAMKAERQLPVRELLALARDAVLALRPCVLASPLTVSQSLPADIDFDAVIFDEASQVTPAEAVNCIYRGRSLIIAGDDRQLPPTSFFDRSFTAVDQDTEVLDYQSVLELAKACGAFPGLSLTWHYRSRHPALVAFANDAFYQGRLSTFPAPAIGGPDTGVELFPVAGVYRRATSRDNPVEAERVAERIVHHFTTRPEQTLGVVTFSVAQAEAIERALTRISAGRPDQDRAVTDVRLHGFFVKSLESVQGDERDVMIFSIGYGYDEAGRISANFGALNRPNGWRRLNVAITRARHRVEIVTSILSRDVPESENEGVRQLAAYLDYVEHDAGGADLDRVDGTSEFVNSVLESVRGWGYPATAGLGTAGGRIDIAIRHPDDPAGDYLLGVRCDGPGYRDCPAARDRDRLYDQVLRGLGWRLHRAWALAWYRDRAGEEARLMTALEQAAASRRGRTGPVEAPAASRAAVAPARS